MGMLFLHRISGCTSQPDYTLLSLIIVVMNSLYCTLLCALASNFTVINCNIVAITVIIIMRIFCLHCAIVFT